MSGSGSEPEERTETGDRLRGLFVTGTDTEVGKTYVTCLVARALNESGVSVGAYKPACSGSFRDTTGRKIWEDIEALHAAIGGDFERDLICPQRFEAPAAPPVAAEMEGRRIDESLLAGGAARWTGRCEVLLVEGAGGLLSPIGTEMTNADLALRLGYPLLIVARGGLGTINHTLLTIEAARSRGLPMAGVILNDVVANTGDVSVATNAAQIERFGDVPILGNVEHAASWVLRRSETAETIPWQRLAQPPRPA